MFTTRGKIIFVSLIVLLAAGVMFAVVMMPKDSDGMNSNKIPTGNVSQSGFFEKIWQFFQKIRNSL